MVDGNLGIVERLLRVTILPLAFLVAAFAVGAGSPKGTLPLTMAFILIVTGVVGHCPLRAIVLHGRQQRPTYRA